MEEERGGRGTAPAVTPIIVEVMDDMTRMSCGCSHPTLTARAYRSQLGTTETHANSTCMDIQLLGELIFQLLSERKSQRTRSMLALRTVD